MKKAAKKKVYEIITCEHGDTMIDGAGADELVHNMHSAGLNPPMAHRITIGLRETNMCSIGPYRFYRSASLFDSGRQHLYRFVKKWLKTNYVTTPIPGVSMSALSRFSNKKTRPSTKRMNNMIGFFRDFGYQPLYPTNPEPIVYYTAATNTVHS